MVLNAPAAFLGAIAVIWAIGITAIVALLYRSFNRLRAGTNKERLEDVLSKLGSQVDRQQLVIQKIQKDLDSIKSELPSHIQKVGLVRFNPFTGTGGNQSFSLALLDGNDSGLVITSLHSREGTRLYTKPIKHNQSQLELSKEEQLALRNARKSIVNE